MHKIAHWASFRRASKLPGKRTGAAGAGHDEQSCHRQATAVLQHHVGRAIDPGHRRFFGRHAAPGQGCALRVVRRERLVQEQGDTAPVRQHQGMVHRHLAGSEHADVALVEFVPVAIRAVENAAPPSLGKSIDRRQRVGDPGGQYKAPAHDLAAIGERDQELVAGRSCRDRRFVCPGNIGVGEQLRPALGRDRRRLLPVLGQEAVRMRGIPVAALAGVDDQYAAACARQLHGSRQSGVAAANDDDVEDDAEIRLVVGGVHGGLLRVGRTAH